MLWRIAFFVEGKNLEKVLGTLSGTGAALNMEAPQPVNNAVVSKDKGTRKVTQAGTGTAQDDLVWDKLKGKVKHGETISSLPIREAMSETHISIGNYSSVLARLTKKGRIKSVERGSYKVIGDF